MEVKIYTRSTCPYCRKTKRLLEENGIEFENIEVSEDIAAKKEMIAISGQMGVPVIVVDDKVITGYHEDKIKEALNIR